MSADPGDDPSEGITGWIRVLVGAVVVTVLPIWLMGAAMLLHLNSSWSELPTLIGFPIAAAVSAFWLGLIGVMVVAFLLLIRGFGRLSEARANAYRAKLDRSIEGDAALPQDAWGDPGAAPAQAEDDLEDFTETNAATDEAQW